MKTRAPAAKPQGTAAVPATGIESLVWLTDIAGLSREEAVASQRWTARALLQQALTRGLRPQRASPTAAADLGHFDTDAPAVEPALAFLTASLPHDGGPGATRGRGLAYVTQGYLT